MKQPAVLRRIIDVGRGILNDKEDIRYLECGHTLVVPKTRLHPMRSRCRPCEEASPKK